MWTENHFSFGTIHLMKESLDAVGDLATQAMQALKDFIVREKDAAVDESFEKNRGFIKQAIDGTLKVMAKTGVKIPRAESALKLARVALTAAPLLFPAQGEAAKDWDALKTVRDGITQMMKEDAKVLRDGVKQYEGSDVAIESIVRQTERTMRELAQDSAFLERHRAYAEQTGLHAPKDFYPLRIVLANVLSPGSIEIKRFNLNTNEAFKTKMTEVLKFSPALDDVGDFTGKDNPQMIRWLYDHPAIKALQGKAGDPGQLRLFEALIEGPNGDPDLYERARTEFDITFLKHLNWDAVQVATHEGSLIDRSGDELMGKAH